MIAVGILESYFVAVGMLKAGPGSAGSADWWLILGLGGIPALLAVALRSKMPESPRWLMLHGRYDATRQAFGRLGMVVTVDVVRREPALLPKRGCTRRGQSLRHTSVLPPPTPPSP